MSAITINCPYCAAEQELSAPGDYRPFYVNCPDCARRFIVEPVEHGFMIFKDGEAPCCSDPECRELEMGDGGED